MPFSPTAMIIAEYVLYGNILYSFHNAFPTETRSTGITQDLRKTVIGVVASSGTSAAEHSLEQSKCPVQLCDSLNILFLQLLIFYRNAT
jgi:hypothetical protein